MHLHGQQISGVLEKYSFTSSFFWLKMQKKNVFEDKCFISIFFYQIKVQAATYWSSYLEKHQFDFFSNNRYFMQFSKFAFFLRFFTIVSSTRKNRCMGLILCEYARRNPTKLV